MPRLHALCLSAIAILASTLAAQTTPKPPLTLEQPAPELAITDPDNKPSSLAILRAANPDKILVLQFASITDPIFRLHNDAVEKLASKNAAKAAFILIYQKEAHAADSTDALEVNKSDGFNIAQPLTLAERQKLAKQTIDRLHIAHQTVVVDSWNNASSQRYGSLPNMTFLVDAKDKLQAGYPFMDMAKVQAAIDLLAAGQPLPASLKGATQQQPSEFDAAAAAADMTGGRGPAAIAAALERITLNDAQKRSVLAGIAEFMADVQTFRQARGNQPARANAVTTAPARGARGADRGLATPQVQDALTTLRASAEKLKGIIKGNLTPTDAAALYQALDQVIPAQRLFSAP